MDITLFFQRLVDGIELGAIYAPLALALVLIYRSTGILNFAQGEMAMFCAFLTWYLVDVGSPIWVAIITTMAIALVAGALIERVLIRPVDPESPLAIVIVTIGLLVVLNALANYLFGAEPRTFGDLFPRHVFDVGGVRFGSGAIGVLAVLLAISGVLFLLFTRTKIGLALRAVAANPESSRLVGIPVGRLLMLGWGMAAALGALGGALISPKVFIEPNMMLGVLVYAFAAATVGGLDSPLGAVLGGLLVGLAESLVGGYFEFIGSSLRLASAFVLILAFLLVRPNGLFGSHEVSRA